jgi:D-xylose 1-dehydrogenase (NADP+, D-xylono-1,5-lactone-forming)
LNTNPLRLGILSTAAIGARILAAAAGSPDVEVVAVASRELSRAERLARDWSVERAYGSYNELLADEAVDAVYVPLPNSLHVDWSIRALEAGKHVLCEKPLDRRPERVEAAFDAADRAGRVLSEAFMFRYHPQTTRIHELVLSGAIGTVQTVHASFSFRASEAQKVLRLQPHLDGGALMDVGCYCISAARLLAGEPVHVFGEQILVDTGADVRFNGTLRFPGDVIAMFDAGLAAADWRLRVVGNDGVLVAAEPWHCRVPRIELRRPDVPVEVIDLEVADSYALELAAFAAAVAGEPSPLLGRADAVAQARVLEALHRSAAEGRTVPVPAQGER